MHQALATAGRRVKVHPDNLQEWHGRIVGIVNDEEVVVKAYNGEMATCPITALSTQDNREDTSLPHMAQEHTLRMLGDNFTLTRAQWEELLDQLHVASDLHKRITDLLKEDPE